MAVTPAPLDALMALLASTPHDKVHFEERRESAFTSEIIIIKGVMEFRRPNTLIKETTSPVQERFVIEGHELLLARQQNGKTVTHRVQLDDYPAMAPLVIGVQATLAGNRAELERHYTVELHGELSNWRLHLVPREQPPEDEWFGELVSRVDIFGRQGDLSRIEITESNGDRNVTRLYKPPAKH